MFSLLTMKLPFYPVSSTACLCHERKTNQGMVGLTWRSTYRMLCTSACWTIPCFRQTYRRFEVHGIGKSRLYAMSQCTSKRIYRNIREYIGTQSTQRTSRGRDVSPHIFRAKSEPIDIGKVLSPIFRLFCACVLCPILIRTPRTGYIQRMQGNRHRVS